MTELRRRDLLKATAGAGLAAALGCAAPGARAGRLREENLIRKENQRPGTTEGGPRCHDR